jgi:hypothetical protein
MEMKRGVIAGAVFAAACQFMNPTSTLKDAQQSNPLPIIDYDADHETDLYDFSTYEEYYDLESLERSLEEKLGFCYKEGMLVKKLGAGTGHEVLAYLIKGQADGPTALIAAPHADEIGAWQAALELTRISVKKGNLVVIPWLDDIAMKHGARYNFVDGADPNREFGSHRSGTYVSNIADDIKQILGTGHIDLVLNLHEAFGYHSLNRNHLGQTVIADTYDLAVKAQDFLTLINDGLKGKDRFSVLLLQSEPTLTYHCAFRNNPPIPAFGIETSKNMDDEKSKSIHLRNARILLGNYGIVLPDKPVYAKTR